MRMISIVMTHRHYGHITGGSYRILTYARPSNSTPSGHGALHRLFRILRKLKKFRYYGRSGRSVLNAFKRFKSTPTGQAILTEERDLVALLDDRQALSAPEVRGRACAAIR